MHEATVHLQTLTPLWTGDAIAGTMTRVHEKGLIGSLRWWYEALVRGHGGWACDPTERGGTCLLNVERYREGLRAGLPPRRAAARAGICNACFMFGATGWQRLFRIHVDGGRTASNVSGYSGALSIRIESLSSRSKMPTAPNVAGIPNTIQSLTEWIGEYGVLGRRTQSGFGAFRVTAGAYSRDGPAPATSTALALDLLALDDPPMGVPGGLPAVDRMYFGDLAATEDRGFRRQITRIGKTPEDRPRESVIHLSWPLAGKTGTVRVFGWASSQQIVENSQVILKDMAKASGLTWPRPLAAMPLP